MSGDPIDRTADVIDSDDNDALRVEILALRDSLAAAGGREEVLEDRVEELEQQVEELARMLEKLERVTANPAVRALITITRPVRHRLERRRGGA